MRVVPKSGTLWPSAGWEAEQGARTFAVVLEQRDGLDWTGETGYLGSGWASCTVWEALGPEWLCHSFQFWVTRVGSQESRA